MKKNFFRVLALSALLILGANGVQAQRSYDCPPLNAEYKAAADEVIKLENDDPDKANKSFMKLLTKIKKSKEDLVAVGTYFLEQDNYPCASYCAKNVYEIAPTYIPGLMFSGEVYMKAQQWGAAGQKFDEVLNLDEENLSALKRDAFVYKNVNPHAAIDYLNKIKAIDPSYYDAEKELGDIYFKLDQHKDAIEHYEAYYKAAPKDATHLDIRSCENFLMSLYSQANFSRITELTSELQPIAPNELMIRRMDFFAKVNNIGDALDYDAAVKAAEDASAYLSDPQYADSTFIYTDYEYRAALAKEKSDIPDAIKWYEKALAKDAKQASGYKEVSNLYVRNKETEKGLEAYTKYLELKGDKADLSDRFLLGTKYMAAYQEDSISAEKKADYFAKADAIFAEVMEKKPDYVQAVVFRARLNNTDSQKPIAAVRDLYNKVLEVSQTDQEKYKNYRFEACRYLFFYDVSIEPADMADAKRAYEMAKSINPDDAFVKNAATYLKQMGL